ncbi:MAG TPA: hypothetical protein PKG95_08890 [Anaerolineaceae bacterium]|nr:hypothetical protein [Anaerolineaceae bacterium]
MSRIDRLAFVLALLTILSAAWITDHVFEGLPHLEDEMAYVWQAQAIEGGHLTLPTPPCPRCFLQPFVVDHEGLRSGKYPPGWPALLAVARWLGLQDRINPLLSGLAVWLIYRLGKKLTNERIGLLAAFLAATSPLFLMNSGALLAHPWTLVLSTVMALGWLDTFVVPTKLPLGIPLITAALALGVLALTRPLTAIGVALPFIIHALILFLRGPGKVRWWLAGFAALAGILASLHFAWQMAVTGNPFINPYTLWWPYDKIGFGPDVGLQAGGYQPAHAWYTVGYNLWIAVRDMLGWGTLSWLMLPFGLLSLRRNKPALLIGGVFPALVLAYAFYWIAAWVLGPRYYFEGLYGWTILTAAGIDWLAGNPFARGTNPKLVWLNKARFILIAVLTGCLIGANLTIYLPQRLGALRGLYGVTTSALEPFRNAETQGLTPALIMVHPIDSWVEYGNLLSLSSPYLDTPYIFTISRGPETDDRVAALYPNRQVFHYYADTPWVFYETPR